VQIDKQSPVLVIARAFYLGLRSAIAIAPFVALLLLAP
jgi:hypothetical protein